MGSKGNAERESVLLEFTESLQSVPQPLYPMIPAGPNDLLHTCSNIIATAIPLCLIRCLLIALTHTLRSVVNWQARERIDDPCRTSNDLPNSQSAKTTNLPRIATPRAAEYSNKLALTLPSSNHRSHSMATTRDLGWRQPPKSKSRRLKAWTNIVS